MQRATKLHLDQRICETCGYHPNHNNCMRDRLHTNSGVKVKAENSQPTFVRKSSHPLRVLSAAAGDGKPITPGMAIMRRLVIRNPNHNILSVYAQLREPYHLGCISLGVQPAMAPRPRGVVQTSSAVTGRTAFAVRAAPIMQASACRGHQVGWLERPFTETC